MIELKQQELDDSDGAPEVANEIADELIRRLNPRTVLDAACGAGKLVKALRDRNVDAWGVDRSEELIGKAPADVIPYCRLMQPYESVQERFDLVVCIDAIRSMNDSDGAFLRSMASITNRCLFSASPVNGIGAKKTTQWLDLLAVYGLAPNISFDATFIRPHAMLLQRQPPLSRDVAALFAECVDLRYQASRQFRTDLGSSSSTTSAELARYKERTNILEAQLLREREYLDTLRNLHAYMAQELQRQREDSARKRTANADDLQALAMNLRAELAASVNGSVEAANEKYDRSVRQFVEVDAKFQRIEALAGELKRQLDAVAISHHEMRQSRIWRTLVKVSGVLLRMTGGKNTNH